MTSLKNLRFYESKYPNGRVEEKHSTLKDGRLHGPMRAYYENGGIKEFTNYKNGCPDGISLSYNSSGELYQKLGYKEGKFHGKCCYCSIYQRKILEEYYIEGKFVSKEEFEKYSKISINTNK